METMKGTKSRKRQMKEKRESKFWLMTKTDACGMQQERKLQTLGNKTGGGNLVSARWERKNMAGARKKNGASDMG
ncbi:hypothetical protein An01g03710 [Aspergillus niger]|uniref:Uncharacterized protein n=2 Tax=Aspergillus niger TaxID=5061 RepID=A2Q8B2_ASPNC|nr:hypothetical protein An01g03710 [Aspergillus niger]CAK36909.1 hypothetical protein An01g03710 [Aspergillus niger]